MSLLETYCRVKWSLGLLSVPTVISSFEHGRGQVYVGLCNRCIWEVMAICSRVVMLSWVNWTWGGYCVLLVVPPWNDLAPCLSMAQLSPGTHTSSKRGLCSAKCPSDTWEGDGWPLTMGDVTLAGLGMAQFGGLELNGIQESRHHLRHCWLVCWFNENLLVSAQNILIWFFFFFLHTLKNRGIWTFRWLDLLYKTAGKWICWTLFGFDFYFKISVKYHYCTKKRTDFTNYKPFLYCLCPEREKLLEGELFFSKKSVFRLCICHFCAAGC